MNARLALKAVLVIAMLVAPAASTAATATDTGAAPAVIAPSVDLTEAGLTMTLPEHWRATREGSQVYLTPDDQSLAMVICISDEAGLDHLVGAIRSNQKGTLSDVRVTKTDHEEVNGLQVTTESGAARGTDGPAVWSLRVIRGARPVVVYTLASPDGQRIHERDLASLLGSLRKYEGTR